MTGWLQNENSMEERGSEIATQFIPAGKHQRRRPSTRSRHQSHASRTHPDTPRSVLCSPPAQLTDKSDHYTSVSQDGRGERHFASCWLLVSVYVLCRSHVFTLALETIPEATKEFNSVRRFPPLRLHCNTLESSTLAEQCLFLLSP